MKFSLSFEPQLLMVAEDLAALYHFSLTMEKVIPRLHLGEQGLELITAKFKPLRIDFNTAYLRRRAFVGKRSRFVKSL